MKVLAFAGSTSKESINKQLVEFAASYFDEVQVLDLNDYEMPIFSMDKEISNGVPQLAIDFSNKIGASDLLLISLAEHNGAYSAAFKNILDWVSRIPNKSVFQDKSVFVMATSPGPRGGGTVLEIALNRFPFNGATIVGDFSLPSFGETFEKGKGISNPTLREELANKLAKIKLEA